MVDLKRRGIFGLAAATTVAAIPAPAAPMVEMHPDDLGGPHSSRTSLHWRCATGELTWLGKRNGEEFVVRVTDLDRDHDRATHAMRATLRRFGIEDNI